MPQPAQQGLYHGPVAQKIGPLVVDEIRGDDGGTPPIAFFHQLEKDVRLLRFQIQISKFVDKCLAEHLSTKWDSWFCPIDLVMDVLGTATAADAALWIAARFPVPYIPKRNKLASDSPRPPPGWIREGPWLVDPIGDLGNFIDACAGACARAVGTR